MTQQPKIISFKELSRHNEANDCWILINSKVFDVTPFMEKHPGGPMKLFEFAGKDATAAFQEVGHTADALEMSNEFLVGNIQTGAIPQYCRVENKPMNSRQWILLGVALVLFLIGMWASKLDYFKKYEL